jgi:hypothetical protein
VKVLTILVAGVLSMPVVAACSHSAPSANPSASANAACASATSQALLYAKAALAAGATPGGTFRENQQLLLAAYVIVQHPTCFTDAELAAAQERIDQSK